MSAQNIGNEIILSHSLGTLKTAEAGDRRIAVVLIVIAVSPGMLPMAST
jgi:hypothetical protein